jgi:hypothetical protein
LSKQDSQRLIILVVLIAVLGLIILLGYQKDEPATASVVQTRVSKTPVDSPAAIDAKLLDFAEIQSVEERAGKRDVFQYYQAPAHAPVPQRKPLPGPPDLDQTPLRIRPPQAPNVGLPPIQLKYQGYAASTAPNGTFTAFLADDSRHYNVIVGEILMGRYRVLNISDKTVDIDDLDYNRRESLPIVK